MEPRRDRGNPDLHWSMEAQVTAWTSVGGGCFMGLSPSACGSVMQLGSEGTDLQNTQGVSGQSEGDLV